MAAAIYQWRNTETGKLYIGSAINVARRKASHLSMLRRGISGNKHLQAAWTKHGESVFVFEILEAVDNVDVILQHEQTCIDQHDPTTLYNILSLAGSIKGYRHSAETREKIGASFRGQSRPPEVIRKIAAANTGKKRSDETRQRIRQVRLDYIALHGILIGGAQLPEVRAKMSEAARKHNAVNGNSFAGKKHSEATRERLREATLKQHAEYGSPVRGLTHSETAKAKMRAAWIVRKQRAT